MFPGEEDGGGHAGEREDRTFLVPASGGGGGGGDGGGGGGGADGDDAGAPQPGCMGFVTSWRNRRARIGSTAGDLPVKVFPPRVPSDETPQPQIDMEDLILQEISAEISRERQRRVRADLPLPNPSAETARQLRVRTDQPQQELSSQSPGNIAPLFKELGTDVDSLIVSKLPSLRDRCALQAVSRRWRHRWSKATRRCASPPFPLVANANFTMTDCFAKGPRSVPLQMNSEVPRQLGCEVTCLGSLDNWMVLAFDEWDPQGNLALPHTSCFLVQPVNGKFHRLPSPCSCEVEAVSGSVGITGGNGRFVYYQPSNPSSLRLKKAVMSESENAADSKVMGLATQGGSQHVVFSTPAASSWRICSADFITVGSDIEFLEDKLVILGNNQEELYQIDFGDNLSFFPCILQVKRCMDLNLPQVANTERQLNLVRSGAQLWLVARHFTLNWEQLTAVRVYQLDALSWTWKEIHGLGGRCVLVSLSCSQAIIASAAGQMGPKSDHVYFLDQFCPNFFPGEDDDFAYRSQVYSMADGTVEELLIGSGRGTRRPGFPMWFFPSGC